MQNKSNVATKKARFKLLGNPSYCLHPIFTTAVPTVYNGNDSIHMLYLYSIRTHKINRSVHYFP